MWSLKRNVRYPHWPDMRCFKSTLSNRLKTAGMTCGSIDDELEDDPDSILAQYSETLRALINECLLVSPHERPSAEELLERTKDGLVRPICPTISNISMRLYDTLHSTSVGTKNADCVFLK